MRLLTVVRQESPVTLAREVLWRTRRHWRKQRLRKELKRRSCPVTYRAIGYYQKRLDVVGSNETNLILRYADAVCAGQFPWFAYGSVSLGFPPRWDMDFISGASWPHSPAEKIPVVRRDGSDVKVPWDLSRLQFLPILGKAWRISGEERYRDAGIELLNDWMEKNPPGIGVNWTIAMEPALRAISICLFLDLLASSPEDKSPFIENAARCLWQHLLFIEAHNEFSHLVRSNHYLSNIVGLFCLSAFLQGPHMEARRLHYKSLIEREMLRQVYEDGGHFEASTGYHVLCLEMFTHAFLLMRSLQIEPAAAFSQRLERMYAFLAALTDARGRVPQLGDCDDGRVELFSDDLEQLLEATLDNRHSLTLACLLRIGESLFGESYGGSESKALCHGQASKPDDKKNCLTGGQGAVTFKSSGVAVARSGDLEIIFSAMPNGIAGKGSHTHNDKLSLVVRIGDEELFVDSGTGCYTRDAELRNHFRSTAAHNTVQIDDEEQNRLTPGLFRVCDDAHVSPIKLQEDGNSIMLRSSHDGYRRLGVMHTRAVMLTSQPSLMIADVLTASATHRFKAFFHIGCHKQIAIEQAYGREVKCQISHGARLVKMSCSAPVDLHLTCIPSKISTAYGLVREATTILIDGRFQSSVELRTQIN